LTRDGGRRDSLNFERERNLEVKVRQRRDVKERRCEKAVKEK